MSWVIKKKYGWEIKKESKDRLMSESHHFYWGGGMKERKGGVVKKSGKNGGCRATTDMGKRGQRKGKGGIERGRVSDKTRQDRMTRSELVSLV